MLESIWFVLWGVLWAVYFMLDGYDLGAGVLTPFLARDETEKRIIYQTIGPLWNGNEVWLITAGGVTFAAFPGTYAVMFSALYSALMLVLFALIIRGVSLEFRSKVDSPGWRRLWDLGTFVGSLLPAVLLGVAFANIFKGIPIDAQGANQGGLLDLINWYGLLGGVLFLLLFLVHGSLWIAFRTGDLLQARAAALAGKLWFVLLAVAVLFLVATAFATNLWDNYLASPLLLVIPLAAVACLLLTMIKIRAGAWLSAWGFSAGTIVSCTLYGVIGLYPALLPSSLSPEWSMTIHNSASSPLTLKIMLGVAAIMVPVVIIYQFLVHRFFSHKVSPEETLEEAY
jgi:cytochrome d ubiquinol oxidase subunit II